MPRLRPHPLVQSTLLILAVTLSGCSSNSPETTLATAQVALDTVLDGWSRNEPPEKFACVDPDWKAGYRLVSFLTSDAKRVGEGRDQVRCRVALSLKDRQGKKLDKDAFYLVQLGETITIRRDDKK
jgi:hypothetical protein